MITTNSNSANKSSYLKYQFPTATDLGGFNGNVYTMEADDDGNIYVGGNFTQAYGVSASHFVRNYIE